MRIKPDICNNRAIFKVLSHLFQCRKGSAQTGGKFDPATGSVVCQFVYVLVL
jgi:thiamine biosynthesis lipoprotein ApbE